jgi:hypothetical protein
MPRPRALLAAALLAFGAAVSFAGCADAGPAQAAKRSVPQGFIGANTGSILGRPGFNLDPELAVMASAGVESVRTGFFWSDLQPYRTAADVPAAARSRFQDVGGVPTDFTFTDRFVAAAAAHGIGVLPVVVTAPAWARRDPSRSDSAPQGTANYARLLTALIGRYGPRGEFWRAHPEIPKRPIRAWQIWNEPDHDYYWHEQPFQRDYVQLLRAARTAIRRADPGAAVVLGGLAGRSWDLLAKVYRAGGRGQFDVAAIHPYTLKVSNVITTLGLVRDAIRRGGDAGRPVWITEMSWPAAKGKVDNPYGIETTQAGMTANIRTAFPLLARRRSAYKLQRVYWESWLTEYKNRHLAWDWAGLRKYGAGSPLSMPAFFAFRAVARTLEGCAKSTVATRCR